VLEGDKIYTAAGARVEIQLEDDVVVRLDEESFVHFESLDENRSRLGVVQGTVAVHARPVTYWRPPVEIHTAFGTASIPDSAIVRIQVEEQGPAEFRVRRGSIEVDRGNHEIIRLSSGQRLFTYGPEVHVTAPPAAEDTFDEWCDLQDAIDAASRSTEYVSDHVSGYSDLDRHGDWVVVEDYGSVWRPRVFVNDWAPYRDGRWVWRDACGWLWVSNEPWGWVPYHYGRWVHHRRHGWCWVPHDLGRGRRPHWAPALVAFTYADTWDGYALSFRFRSWDGPCIGWFPLGPADPWYGWHWRDGHRRHRDHHDGHYQNQHVAKAISIVPREDFGRNRYERIEGVSLVDGEARNVKVGRDAVETVDNVGRKAPLAKRTGQKIQPPPRIRTIQVPGKVPSRFNNEPKSPVLTARGTSKSPAVESRPSSERSIPPPQSVEPRRRTEIVESSPVVNSKSPSVSRDSRADSVRRPEAPSRSRTVVSPPKTGSSRSYRQPDSSARTIRIPESSNRSYREQPSQPKAPARSQPPERTVRVPDPPAYRSINRSPQPQRPSSPRTITVDPPRSRPQPSVKRPSVVQRTRPSSPRPAAPPRSVSRPAAPSRSSAPVSTGRSSSSSSPSRSRSAPAPRARMNPGGRRTK